MTFLEYTAFTFFSCILLVYLVTPDDRPAYHDVEEVLVEPAPPLPGGRPREVGKDAVAGALRRVRK